MFDEPLDDLLESLLAMAQPGLFRANAFRVIGLLSDATDSAIRKQAEKLQFQVRHGGNTGRWAGPLSLDAGPLTEMVPEAIQRLRDPERRFFEEFFWFWPQPGLGPNDEAIEALTTRDIETAVEIWRSEIERADDGGRASHNLAVMFHTLALDIEYARRYEPIVPKLRNVQYTYWQSGLSQWYGVLSDEQFWQALNMRVAELNDPRLTNATTRQLRSALPTILLLISAQLAVSATERGAFAEAQQYRLLMQESGFDGEVVADACARTAFQIRRQISAICRAADQDATAHPVTADEGVRRLLQQSRSLLTAIDLLVANGSPMSNEARDEVANTATNCLLMYANAAGSWKIALELLDLTRPCAVNLAMRERIDDLRTEFFRHAYSYGQA